MSMMQQNFDISVEDLKFSTHISTYLERYIFLAFLWYFIFGEKVSLVDIEELVHKFSQSLEVSPLEIHEDKHDAEK